MRPRGTIVPVARGARTGTQAAKRARIARACLPMLGVSFVLAGEPRTGVPAPAAPAAAVARVESPRDQNGNDPVGRPAPALGLDQWLGSRPLEISDLRGKVVLVRWWTDTCPLCEATAPALRALDRAYRDQGLVVLGVFHPKPPGDHSVARMKRAAEALQLDFPVALDSEWKALDRWWLHGHPRGWTSVTFLIDRQGIVRYVHEGGEFHEGPGGPHLPDHARCRADYREIERTIVRLLDR